MAYVCHGLCERYCTNSVVTAGHASIFTTGIVRCSVCRTGFSKEHTRIGHGGVVCCSCCGCRVRANPRVKRRMLTPAIKVVQTKK